MPHVDAVINYEVTTYTSGVSGSSPSSNPYIAIYGRKSCTKEKPLVGNAEDRGRYFKSGGVDKFVLEVPPHTTFTDCCDTPTSSFRCTCTETTSL